MTTFLDIPDDETDAIAEQLAQTVERTDYNLIAKYYNSKPVGKIFHFDFPKTKLASLKKQLEVRGLLVDADVTVAIRPIDDTKDAATHAFLRRLTDKEAQIVTIKVGRRKKETATEETKDEKSDAKPEAGKADAKPPAAAPKKTVIGGKKK